MARDLDVGYLGVVVDDRDPQAIFDSMAAALATARPDVELRNGDLATVLLEVFATASADVIYAVNRVLGALVETVLVSYGVERDLGAAATGSLALTFDGAVTVTVAAGTQFLADDGSAVVAVRDTPITSASSATVDVEEAVPGVGALLTAGQAMSPASGIPRLSTCTLSAALAGGRPAEDDPAFFARVATRQRRVTSSLVVDTHFVARALEDPRVGRAAAIDRWDTGTSSLVDGHMTVAVYGRGVALASDVLTDIDTYMNAESASILTVHVIPAVLVPVDITAGITVASGFTSSDTTERCEQVLAEWLAWTNAGFGQTVTPTAIEAVLANVPGVSAAVVTLPTGDVATDPWEIPSPGTIDVHV